MSARGGDHQRRQERQREIDVDRRRRDDQLDRTIDELLVDFLHDPEQVGNFLAGEEAAGRLEPGKLDAVYGRIADSLGRDFADRALGMDSTRHERATSGLVGEMRAEREASRAVVDTDPAPAAPPREVSSQSGQVPGVGEVEVRVDGGAPLGQETALGDPGHDVAPAPAQKNVT